MKLFIIPMGSVLDRSVGSEAEAFDIQILVTVDTFNRFHSLRGSVGSEAEAFDIPILVTVVTFNRFDSLKVEGCQSKSLGLRVMLFIISHRAFQTSSVVKAQS